MKEQKARRTPIILHECTPLFPESLLRAEFADNEYLIESIVVGPEDLGLPTDRRRRYTLVLKRDTYGLRGTFYDAPKFLARSPVMTGDIYFAATPEMVAQEIREMGARLCIDSATTWDQVLPPAQQSHLQAYRELVTERQMQKSLRSSSSSLESCSVVGPPGTEAPPFLFDLSQAPWARARMGRQMPVLLRSSNIWNEKRGRGLTRQEALLAVGVPAVPSL
eukprot:10123911-Alexandrium_andersonii.AAC.1